MKRFTGHQLIDIWAFEERDASEKSTPRMFYLVFDNVDSFLTIELTGDGEHIDFAIKPLEKLNILLTKYSGKGFYWTPTKWSDRKPYDKIVGKTIDKIELAIDQPEYEQADCSGIRFYSGSNNLILFNNGDESYLGYNSEFEPAFPDSYKWLNSNEKK